LKISCELVVKYFIPAIRAMVAMRLVKDYGLTQVEAAKKLNTTQPAISYYVRSLRGGKALEALQRHSDILNLVDEMVKVVIEGYEEEFHRLMCEACKRIREKSELMNMFSE